MTILTEREVEVTCRAEDVDVATISPATADRMKGKTTATVWTSDVTEVRLEVCGWTGLVTEQIYNQAGIAEWVCPMCRTVHMRDVS